jgi:hypothetical protein
MGFTFVSQANNLYQPGLYPFRHPWGVWELPLYYMDNMDFWAPVNWPGDGHQPFASRWIEHAVSGSALYVFDFHPVHVALNTRSPEDYQRVKHQIIERGVSPFDLAFEGRGAREYFMELCAAMRTAGQRSMTCSEALEAWSRHER